ncbi:hypothetical protein [Nocardioides sp.]|uniref:hypothetical protein n=1 Tax=Nocardioides sp. TaxID=35761 RepID=UPI0039E22089
MAVAVGLTVTVLSGCSKDPYDAYCGTVKEHQQELTRAVDEHGLLAGLGTFEEFQVKAPEDIREDWRTVVDALNGLRTALDDAGIDSGSYDPAHPPAGLGKAEQERITAAADRLASQPTKDALQAVEQQARDVCHTPLTL